jgi:1,2-diacylglycerol 3-beta-glucosyltransferase
VSAPGAEVSLPFEGLPAEWLILFVAAFLLISLLLVWTGSLFVVSRGARREAGEAGATEGLLWVFLVPALDEEITIRDSIERLLEVEAEQSLVVVVDDGSSDRTGEIAAAEAERHPNVHLISRTPPDARQGKAAALNAVYRAPPELIEDWPRERVIAVVVDADGRLAADAPEVVAPHFDDPQVGGVQVLVRIYNRNRLLTWLQDVEFSIFGFLFQAARSRWGTAGMGGNGQFNRLSALDQVADADGPWRDRLTEDQDLGLRLIVAGWEGRQELGATVEQQGLPGLRRLFRQRTRWAQGNLQAIAHLGSIWRSPLPFRVRVEQAFYLLNPLFQAFIGGVLIVAIVLALTDVADFWSGGEWWQLVLFYLLGFGGVIFGCLARGAQWGPLGLVRGYLLAHPYAFYSWIIWPSLARAAWRQLTRRRGWAKSARESI